VAIIDDQMLVIVDHIEGAELVALTRSSHPYSVFLS
jgi:hypothetical protein